MSEPWLIWLVSALYSVQGVLWLVGGKEALALVMLGYVCANIGLVIASK